MFISAGKAGNETRKIHGTFVSVQEKQVKKSGKFMEYCMFISARKAGKEITKNHGIFFISAGKQAKKQGQFLVYFYQCKKSRQRNKEDECRKDKYFCCFQENRCFIIKFIITFS